MYSYRFLIGVALVVLLGGAVSSIDLALAGAQPARTLAPADGPAVERLLDPRALDDGLDRATGQLQFQGGFQRGGFNFQGGGFNLQGGGFNFQGGGGFNFNGGGFNFPGGCQGGLNLQGGFQLGSCQGGFQGGLQFQGGINSPVAAGGNGRLFVLTGHLNCATLGEVVNIEVMLSQVPTGAVALGETRVVCTSTQPSWSGWAIAVGPASFLPGPAQACALGVGPTTRTQWCRPGGATLLPAGPSGGPPPPAQVIVLPPPPPPVVPPPPVLVPGPYDPGTLAVPTAVPAP